MEAVLRKVDFKYLKAKRLKAKYLEKVLRKSTQKKMIGHVGYPITMQETCSTITRFVVGLPQRTNLQSQMPDLLNLPLWGCRPRSPAATKFGCVS